MNNNLELFLKTRNNIYNTVKDLTLEEFNHVPKGFSNSIFWNVAHIVVTQQLLIYKFSNNDSNLEQNLIDKYKKGTKFEEKATKEEIDFILNHLLNQVETLNKDLQNNIFTEFNTYQTSYGFELKNFEDAVYFNNIHDALHLGYIMAMKKIVLNK